MTLLDKARKFGLVKIVIGLVVTILFIVYLFRDQIKEHKVTKAKMEMFKRMTENKPEDWDDEFKQVYDSIFTNKKDSTIAN